MAGPGYPSGTNTYVPNHDASQSLVVGYSRNPKTFKIARYAQYIMAKNNVGLYLQWTSRQAARIITPDDAEHLWADGDARPMGYNNLESMQWQPFTTKRRAYDFTIGYMAADQASFNLIAAESADAAQQAMTSRTLRAYNVLSNASWGANTAAVNNGILPSGHDWTTGNDGSGSNQGPNIKQSFQYAELKIHQQTIGVVTPNKVCCVVNPFTAQHMAASTEIQDYIKQSPFALAQLRGDSEAQNGQWGLPNELYGHEIVVEDAVLVSSRRGGTDVLGYVVPNGEAYFLAREGELEGLQGTRSFSTLQIFFYKDELTVGTFDDAKNERYEGSVVTNDIPVVVSPISGFKFTAATPSS